MTLRDRHEKLKGAFRTSLSPPVWKDQLKQRCMQRLRQDRHLLLAKLRSPDATRSIADEMKRLVYHEEQREVVSVEASNVLDARQRMTQQPQQQWRRPIGARHPVFDLQSEEDEAMMSSAFTGEREEENPEGSDASLYASIEELVTVGKLSEDDYLEIVHALEDELLAEMYDGGEEEEQLVEQMVEFEEASLEAMLAGMDLDDPDIFFDDDFDNVETMNGNGVHVLCPICKIGSVKETSTSAGSFPTISCTCGFSFQTKQEPLHGVLEDFQEIIATAFMAHRALQLLHHNRVNGNGGRLYGRQEVRGHERADEEEREQSGREESPDRPERQDERERRDDAHHRRGRDHARTVDAPLEVDAFDVRQIDRQVRCDADVDARTDQPDAEIAPRYT